MPLPLETALIAAVISLLGLVISKEAKVSDFRQKWIDDLRNDLSILIANSLHIGTVSATSSVCEELVKCNEVAARIRLRLNPHKTMHMDVLSAIISLSAATRRMSGAGTVQDCSTLLTDASIVLLRHEWKRVKAGEAIYRWTLRTIATLTFVGLVSALIRHWFS